MSDIIVSAHGGRWSDQAEDLDIPSSSTVVYYVDDGGILYGDEADDILRELDQGNEPGGTVVESVSDGDTYDYACWFAPEFASDCGIFEVGTGTLLTDLSPYSESQPLLLSQILTWYPDCTIYWLCCREISDRSVTAVLKNSAGAHPSPLRWKRALHDAVDAFHAKLR